MRIIGIVVIPLPGLILFLPAWLYRVTLKSTAWFWWPLAYLGGPLPRVKNQKISTAKPFTACGAAQASAWHF